MSKALDNFTEGIKHLIQTAIDKAPFDKTYKGRVLSVANGEYTVLINGKEYPNTPVQGRGDFAVDEVVKVVFPQNNATLRYIMGTGGGGGDTEHAVLYTPQALTDAQKAQARTNIGAGTGGGSDEVYIAHITLANGEYQFAFSESWNTIYDALYNSDKAVVAEIWDLDNNDEQYVYSFGGYGDIPAHIDDFVFSRTEGNKTRYLYVHSDNTISAEVVTCAQQSDLDGKLSDAPSDGKQYARQNGAWAEVESGDTRTVFLITVTENDDVYTPDKTYAEALTAYNAGMLLVMRIGQVDYYLQSMYSLGISFSNGTQMVEGDLSSETYLFRTSGEVLRFTESGTLPSEAQMSAWDNKYSKPSNGIPKTDLSSAVQESLDASSGAVRFDTTQSLTRAQKKQARDNIGAIADNAIWAVNITKNGDTYTADSNYTTIKGAVDLGLFVYAIYDGVYYSFDSLAPNQSAIFSRTKIDDDEAQIQSFRIYDNSVDRLISEYESVVYVDIAEDGDGYIAQIKGQPASVSSIRLYSLTRMQPVVGRYVGSGGYDYFPLRTLTADTAIFTRATISNPPNTISQDGFIINDTSGVSTYEQQFIPYVKPSGGIPKTHLASGVQTSLNNADNAVLYTPQSLTEAQKAQARDNIGAGTGSGGGFYAGDEEPENTDVLWIDTDDDSGNDGGDSYDMVIRLNGTGDWTPNAYTATILQGTTDALWNKASSGSYSDVPKILLLINSYYADILIKTKRVIYPDVWHGVNGDNTFQGSLIPDPVNQTAKLSLYYSLGTLRVTKSDL